MDSIRNGRRKPSVPIEKLSTGGTAPTLNSDDAWRMVPSPPRVMTRSILWAPWPVVNSINDVCVLRRSTYQDATLLHLLVCPVYLHGTLLREGSEFEDGCLMLESGSHTSVFKHTHTRKESMVSMTGFVRSLFTMRIDLTCSAFLMS
jgi:hypothetical protein